MMAAEYVRWRVGTSVGRTIYLQTGPKPSKEDALIGVMDSRILANLVVVAVNDHLQRNPHLMVRTADVVITAADLGESPC